ncbi:STAS-like domain-containing protein [Paenibacillus sp. N4]|uniref:STAS-like domain-containing protein n=1 Tax=Paenibacillus vietnamensis TaxID=2590547 RepID=UPI001CD147D0|nr:STAS-like domain-containing protein [Paenibacillus vietnamensis]MCA0754924.1 STAS-like domain-containing protein [Paenibacillus vietnamensis]
MKVSVNELVGELCITREDGRKLLDNILNDLKKGEVVELDFKDVNIFASPFFNAAVGPLVKEFTNEELERILHIVNINPTGKSLFEIVLNNSSRYFNDANYQKTLDDILTEEEDE